MTPTITSTEPPVTAWNRTGAALTVIGVLTPILLLIAGHLTAYEAGYRTGTAAIALLVIYLLVWLLTRKRSPYTRARARTVIGVLLCSVVFSALARDASKREDFQRVAIQTQELVKQQALADADLTRRMEAIGLDTVLLPGNLITKTGREHGKAKVTVMRSLIAQRVTNEKANLAGFEKLIASVRSESDRRDMRAGMQHALPNSMRVSEELTRAQYAMAEAVDEILDWCGAHDSELKVEGGQFIISNQKRADELDAAYARFSDSVEREHRALAKVQGLHNDAQAAFKEAERSSRSGR